MSFGKGDLIRHYKGGLYVILSRDGLDSETTWNVIEYMALGGPIKGRRWYRKEKEFYDLVKWPDGVERTRFIRCDYPEETVC